MKELLIELAELSLICLLLGLIPGFVEGLILGILS